MAGMQSKVSGFAKSSAKSMAASARQQVRPKIEKPTSGGVGIEDILGGPGTSAKHPSGTSHGAGGTDEYTGVDVNQIKLKEKALMKRLKAQLEEEMMGAHKARLQKEDEWSQAQDALMAEPEGEQKTYVEAIGKPSGKEQDGGKASQRRAAGRRETGRGTKG